MESDVIQRAVIRSLEVIGEAAKNIDTDFKKDHSEVPWRELAGTRDILIHDYFDVDLQITWDIIQKDLPKLEQNIKKILTVLDP